MTKIAATDRMQFWPDDPHQIRLCCIFCFCCFNFRYVFCFLSALITTSFFNELIKNIVFISLIVARSCCSYFIVILKNNIKAWQTNGNQTCGAKEKVRGGPRSIQLMVWKPCLMCYNSYNKQYMFVVMLPSVSTATNSQDRVILVFNECQEIWR